MIIPAETVIDPTGPERGVGRVLRGGCWIDRGGYVRSAYRSRVDPGYPRRHSAASGWPEVKRARQDEPEARAGHGARRAGQTTRSGGGQAPARAVTEIEAAMHDPTLIVADAVAFRAAVREGRPYRPLYVKLKLVWDCNLRCGMCLHWREGSDPSLPTAAWLALIDELAQRGCRKLHLSGGEPTLDRDLDAIIAHAAGQGMRVTMTTNATTLAPQRAARLVAAGLRRANVSLDSPDPAVHDRLTIEPAALTGMIREALRQPSPEPLPAAWCDGRGARRSDWWICCRIEPARDGPVTPRSPATPARRVSHPARDRR
ncbi:MAG: radical SAM protein [Chromatiales bacterium]|nr:radical SAM protein [Chromatiales bacterium]